MEREKNGQIEIKTEFHTSNWKSGMLCVFIVFITIFFNHRSLKSLCIDFFVVYQWNEKQKYVLCASRQWCDDVVCQSKCEGEIGRKSIFGDYIFQAWKSHPFDFMKIFLYVILCFFYWYTLTLDMPYYRSWICMSSYTVATMNHTQIIDFILFVVSFFLSKISLELPFWWELMDDLTMNHLHRHSVFVYDEHEHCDKLEKTRNWNLI